MLTVEDLQAWEKRLTEEQVRRAISTVRANGWTAPTDVPLFVWAEAFRQAEASDHA